MTYEKIKSLNTLFRKDQEKNKDVIIATTGMRGDGKSNFAMVAAWLYNMQFGLICTQCKYEWIYAQKAIYSDYGGYAKIRKDLFEPCPKCKCKEVIKPKKYNFMRFMAYDMEEVESKVKDRDELPDWSPLTCDEAVRFAYSQDFAKSENKEMKKMFNQDRPRKLIRFLNIPKFKRLDSGYREIASYWVWVMQRTDKKALGLISLQDKGSIDDPFRIKELHTIIGSYNEHTPMDILLQKCERAKAKHPCVLDFFMIPPLPEDVYRDYEVYRNIKVFERDKEDLDVDQKELAKIFAFNLVHRWPDFIRQIKKSRFDKPTVRMLEEFIFVHPKTNKPLIRYTTARNWINEIRRFVK